MANEFRKRNAGGLQCGLTLAAGRNAREPAFAPVMITDARPAEAQVEAPAALIEIMLGGATVRLHGGIDGKALTTVLRAVRATA